jgi:hypothetical protein
MARAVRSGLAFTGVAVALIGVGVLLVAFSLSSGTSGSIVEGVSAPHIAPATNYTHVIPSSPQKSANVLFDWSSTRSVQVALYVAGGCPNNTVGYVCPAGKALKTWWSDSGGWSYTGAVSEPWLLVVVNPNSTAASMNGTLVESYPAMSTFGGGINLLILVVGSVVLIGIGALALFLGLFLRGGVYGPKPDPVGQPDSAILDREDLDDEEWENDPASEQDIDGP